MSERACACEHVYVRVMCMYVCLCVYTCVSVCRIAYIANLNARLLCVKHSICYAESRYYIPSMSYPLLYAE